MEKFKFGLFSIVVLGTLGLVWYWSVSTIESGSEHAMKEKVLQLEQENETLTKQVKELEGKLAMATPVESEPVAETPKETTKPPTSTTTTTTDKDQSLINELQKLIDDKINMKQGSAGARVGTVQKFLNRYNNTSTKIDNDYGAGTVKLVTAFQKAEGLSADGEAGATTFTKMIAWLKAN